MNVASTITSIWKLPVSSFELTEEEEKRKMAEQSSEGIQQEQIALHQREFQNVNDSKEKLNADLQQLRGRIDEQNANTAVHKLLPLLRSLKVSETRESDLRSQYDARREVLEAEVSELERKLAAGLDGESLPDDVDRSLNESVEQLNTAKKEFSAKLRAIMSMRRQIDDVATQSELVQYDRRLLELNGYIQERHSQTQKYYATFNALLEIKELMLKETSLLNSISSQFQDAITSSNGRTKLIDSMDGIVKGSQLKLQKVQVAFQEEQNVCNALKKRYAAAVAEQRQCYSLVKAFQRECAKNEKLQNCSCLKLPKNNSALPCLKHTDTACNCKCIRVREEFEEKMGL